jgi:hypothetical protein
MANQMTSTEPNLRVRASPVEPFALEGHASQLGANAGDHRSRVAGENYRRSPCSQPNLRDAVSVSATSRKERTVGFASGSISMANFLLVSRLQQGLSGVLLKCLNAAASVLSVLLT